MTHPVTSRPRVRSLVLATLAALGASDSVAGQGTAIVRVESRMSHPDVRFSFFGDVTGTVSPGESLEASGLASGRHSSSQPAPSPWLTLVEIVCDDQQSATPSTGSVGMRAANFNIDGNETVTCTFVYDGFEAFVIPDDLPRGAGEVALPKPGIWGVTNGPGSMECPGLFSRELGGADYNRGEITVLGDGERIFSDAFDDDREDVMVYRVPQIPGRYTGWVEDTYEGYTVIVHAVYQLITDEWIVGYMAGDMSVESVFCRLYRTFEIRYEEPSSN
ncbi:MAG: hypothetical protein OEO23_09715 [Gemmatimonadota bacterium]|nr:hypothetical protein [Gemmatimonadota bacterium]